MKQTLFSLFFPGLSSVSDKLNTLFFLKPSQSHLLPPALVTIPSHLLLAPPFLLAFPQVPSMSLLLFSFKTFASPFIPKVSTITYTQWLSSVCPIPSPSPELQCYLLIVAEMSLPQCSILNSTCQKLDSSFFPKTRSSFSYISGSW